MNAVTTSGSNRSIFTDQPAFRDYYDLKRRWSLHLTTDPKTHPNNFRNPSDTTCHPGSVCNGFNGAYQPVILRRSRRISVAWNTVPMIPRFFVPQNDGVQP